MQSNNIKKEIKEKNYKKISLESLFEEQRKEEEKFYRNLRKILLSSLFVFGVGFYVYNHTGERIKIYIDEASPVPIEMSIKYRKFKPIEKKIIFRKKGKIVEFYDFEEWTKLSLKERKQIIGKYAEYENNPL